MSWKVLPQATLHEYHEINICSAESTDT